MTEAEPKGTAQSAGLMILRATIQFTFSFAIWGGLMFLGAGTFLWTRGWIHLGLWVITLIVNWIVLMATNPDVIAARLKPKPSAEKFDMILLWAFLPVMLGFPLLAGLDAVRYQWAPAAIWTVYVGVALHAIGDFFVVWSMAVNPYGEKTVRIQEERGHRVITTGPYAIVRHPMYVGVVLLMAAVPLVVGSLWTFVPVAFTALLLIVRTVKEENLLRRELPGYEEYTGQTKYRLVPGIW